MIKAYTPNEYDPEPVFYCSRCYSLKIRHDEMTDSDYCEHCGNTDIQTASIQAWEKLYERRFGHKFVEKNRDPRRTKIFRLTLDELKKKVYAHPLMDDLIKTLYPKFPDGLVKEEKVIVLFDRLSRDNRLDDLKYLLLQYS